MNAPKPIQQDPAMRAAESIRNLRSSSEKREMAHHLCRYLVLILARGSRPGKH